MCTDFEKQRIRDYELVKTTKLLSCLQAKNISNHEKLACFKIMKHVRQYRTWELRYVVSLCVN